METIYLALEHKMYLVVSKRWGNWWGLSAFDAVPLVGELDSASWEDSSAKTKGKKCNYHVSALSQLHVIILKKK